MHLAVAFAVFSAAAPRNQAGRQDVPLTAVVETLNLDHRYSPTIGTFWIDTGSDSIIFISNSNRVYIGNRIAYLKNPVRNHDDRPTVEADGVNLILQEVFGQAVPWKYNGSVFTLDSGSKNRPEEPPGQNRTNTAAPKRSVRSRTDYEINTIIIDAGHGGKDPGGIGYRGLKEKDIVLGVARELEKELKRRLKGETIIMTREDDHFIPLEERASMANEVEPSRNPIFVSVHANVSFTPGTSGFESYFLSIDPFGEKARDVAQKENSVLNFEIEDYNEYIQEILNRIVDIEYRRESMRLAGDIQRRLRGTIGGQSAGRGVKSAFFYVLKASKMPAVLVEVGFVTNKNEALNLQTSEYQKKIAKGIALGIEDFINDFRESKGFTE